MIISSKQDFIDQIKKFKIKTEYVIIKPNWVNNSDGEYTEAEILDWLLEAFTKQKKIVIESYTPWRGEEFFQANKLDRNTRNLSGGKKYWDLYKQQDNKFLKTSGINKVLKKHKAEYLNITNEVWSDQCVEKDIVKKIVEESNKPIKWQEFYSYVPKKLFEIREKSILISLSKIKIEDSVPTIQISMSIKNIFGLIPYPSRQEPFHQNNNAQIPEVIHDIFTVYTTIFKNSLWITEGIKTLMINYCDPKQEIIRNRNLLFLGTNPVKVDEEACKKMGIDPKKVPYLQMIRD
jgi:uncharacterized protein (DUF362 family)